MVLVLIGQIILAEILLKVALNIKNQIKSNPAFCHIMVLFK
jgi:predicted benzoate:H+ symporter BenE